MTEFRQALEQGDVDTLRAAWAKVAPHLPQPASREQAEIAMHRARTEAESIRFEARAYSHAWLSERALPSGLPDHLKPRAQRLYPIIREGVLVGVKSASGDTERAKFIQRAMCDAVEEAYAEGRTAPEYVRLRMAEARRWAKRQ